MNWRLQAMKLGKSFIITIYNKRYLSVPYSLHHCSREKERFHECPKGLQSLCPRTDTKVDQMCPTFRWSLPEKEVCILRSSEMVW